MSGSPPDAIEITPKRGDARRRVHRDVHKDRAPRRRLRTLEDGPRLVIGPPSGRTYKVGCDGTQLAEPICSTGYPISSISTRRLINCRRAPAMAYISITRQSRRIISIKSLPRDIATEFLNAHPEQKRSSRGLHKRLSHGSIPLNCQSFPCALSKNLSNICFKQSTCSQCGPFGSLWNPSQCNFSSSLLLPGGQGRTNRPRLVGHSVSSP